jgi:hypothetical protein
MTHVRKGAALALALATGFTLSACGGGSSTTPSVVTAPAAPQRTLLGSGSFPGLGVWPNDYLRVLVTVAQAGTVELSTDWTFGSDNVGIFFGQGDCLNNLSCPNLGQNISGTKPKTLTVANVQPGTYSLIVVNYGPNNESVSYQVFLTR